MSLTYARNPEEQEQTQHKSTLICPTCGHESPIDGDWAITEAMNDDVRYIVYECPVCWTDVVVQPRFEK